MHSNTMKAGNKDGKSGIFLIDSDYMYVSGTERASYFSKRKHYDYLEGGKLYVRLRMCNPFYGKETQVLGLRCSIFNQDMSLQKEKSVNAFFLYHKPVVECVVSFSEEEFLFPKDKSVGVLVETDDYEGIFGEFFMFMDVPDLDNWCDINHAYIENFALKRVNKESGKVSDEIDTDFNSVDIRDLKNIRIEMDIARNDTIDGYEPEFEISFYDHDERLIRNFVEVAKSSNPTDKSKCRIECNLIADDDVFVWTHQTYKLNVKFMNYIVEEANLRVVDLSNSEEQTYDESDEYDESFEDQLAESSEPAAEVKKEERDPYDYFKLSSLNLYRQDTLSNMSEGDSLESHITFKEGTDCDIVIYAFFDMLKEIKESVMALDMTFNLYDSTGRLLHSSPARMSKEETGEEEQSLCAMATLSREGFGAWTKGMYRVEGSLWGQTVISIRFEVCNKETYGTYDPIASQPRIGKGGRKIVKEVSDARKTLNELVGLKRIKEKINALGHLQEFGGMRAKAGLPFKKVSLHACFLGPSGTGKTTVAGLIGQIYKEMGLLSSGHVVYEERSTLIGRYYDSELKETERAIRNAEGGVLFIDEAYSLFVEDDVKDPGHKVIEALLTALSDENKRDWMLILAGYPKDMEKLLNCNQGLKSRVQDRFYFDELTEDELVEVADLYCRRNNFSFTPEAHRALESAISDIYATRDKMFGNARDINNLMEKQVIPAMATRLCGMEDLPTEKQLRTIEKADIPVIKKTYSSRKMDKLNRMVGLGELKQSISSHLNFVRMVNQRMSHGLYTSMPPLHMIFSGNPGTGKSTVAEFMGEIYASMGVLSHGEVIKVEKRDLVSPHVGETEKKMSEILERAKGNVLFIDEAYQLWSPEVGNDFGRIVVDSLLTTLANDRIDMIVILAGYTNEMERLLSMNSGLRSRFPYTFHFKDYSAEELIEIADMVVKREKFVLSPVARKRLESLIRREVSKKNDSFGNARFVNRMIMTKILPAMASRLAALEEVPTKKQLTTIVAEDIPISAEEVESEQLGGFDEAAISVALKRLDAMVGLKNVKRTVHNFVDVARYLSHERQQYFGNHLMKWNFVGNSGTGKSTVAKIMADILKGMGLIDKSNVVEVKGEEFYNVNEYRCDEILRKAMERSKYGLLFIDSDAPMFKNANAWTLSGEQLRIKLAALTAEVGGNGAVIIAEHRSPNFAMVQSLAKNGILDFDKTLIFDDYTPEELFEILAIQLKKHRAELTSQAADKMLKYIGSLCENRTLSLANARTMKLLAESIIQISLLRESKDPSAAKGQIILDDVQSFEWHKPVGKIGY